MGYSWRAHKLPVVPTTAVLLIAVLACGAATAEKVMPSSSDTPFGDYIHQGYDGADGLPSTWIHDVLQTRDGYLWVATHNGVARFDGVNFRAFNRGNTSQLPANDTRELYESRDGTLWMGSTGGLVRYCKGRPGTFERVNELTRNSIKAIFEDSSGAIWVGTRERTWRAKPGHRFKVVDGAPSIVWAFFQDRTGTIWLGSDFGLYKQQSGGFKRLAEEALPISKDPNRVHRESLVTQLSEDGDGNLLIGTGQGLLVCKDGRFEFNLNGLPSRRVTQILRTPRGETFVIAGNLYRWKDGSCERLSAHHGPTQCITADREGGLWVGNGHNGGLHYYRDNATRRLFANQRVYCVHEDHDGSVWFGSKNGLHRLRDGEIASFGEADGLPAAAVQSISPASDGTLWVGTAKGLAKWYEGRATRISGPTPLTELNINAVCEDSAGVLWMALMGGETRTLKDNVLNAVEELNHGNTQWFYEDSQGSLWIGHEYGLFRVNADGVQQINAPSFERLNTSHFTCHCVDADGTLWLGNAGGIARYQSGRFDVFTSQDGLTAEYIQQLQADNHGNLWVGGRHGFYIVAIREFDKVLSGRLDRLRCRVVEEDYGMSAHAGLRSSPRACLARDGTTWIATGNGLMKVRPKPLPLTWLPPDVHIDRVQVDGQTVNADQPIEYLSGQKRITIDFSSPNFSNPQWVRIKYKLDEHDEEWTDAGGERNVTFTDLEPGQYAFRVKADNGHGVWSQGEAVAGFTVKPRWWETIWLRAVATAGLVLMSLSWAFIYNAGLRRNNVQLRAEVEERKRAEETLAENQLQLRNLSGRLISAQEDEKRRLARNLHDDFSQRLAALAIDADALEMQLDRRPGADEIRDLRERIVDLSNDIHQVSRELHPSIIDDLGLVDALKTEFDSLSEREKIAIDYQYDDNISSALTADVAIGLYRIAQESVRNAIKHAGSDKLHVGLFQRDGQVTLTVVDEGVGFDLQIAKHSAGLGLHSMEERAHLMSGKLSIRSRPGHGTQIAVHVPLQNHQP